MFEKFIRQEIETKETTINLIVSNQDSKQAARPVLLLHGYPQTHACWHQVAPLLAEAGLTVVCPDLRGCGDSGKPPNDERHLAYSKRVMALDQIEIMQSLGYDEFAVVGHDRGARVAHRLALDHPEKITRLVLLDIVPTAWAFANVNQTTATAAFNWFFSLQDDDLPERLIGAEPKFYLHWLLNHWAGKKDALAPEAVAEYERCFDTKMIRATNEEFRAAASIDLDHDRADAPQKIACPVRLLWSGTGMWSKYDILKIWRERAENITGRPLDCGHFLPEEKAEEMARELIEFLL